MSRLKRFSDRTLYAFDKWFTSSNGVWQTLGVCLLIVAVELGFPSIDPHFFWLLMILTVYSAITQPALAQAGAATSESLRLMEEKQNEELAELAEILDDVKELLEEVQEMLEATPDHGRNGHHA